MEYALRIISVSRLEMDTTPSDSSSMFSIINIIFIIVGLFLIYYLYRFLYTAASNGTTTIISSQQAANVPPTTIPSFPQPYEGGSYSVNTWVYINSLNTINTRKHIFELQGSSFSTLLLGLGSFKNSLIVRTHYEDPSEGFQNPMSNFTSGVVERVKSVLRREEGFQLDSGSGSGSGSGSQYTPVTVPTPSSGSGSGSGSKPVVIVPKPGSGSGSGSKPKPITINTVTITPNTSDKAGNLSSSQVTAMFEPMASDDSLVTGTPIQCDIPEIDLQRWTMVTVVLSGKTIDVYIDGKLSRSCVTSSYFRVDPTEDITLNILDRGGFDGYIGNTSVGSYSMNPDEIYSTYLSGPNGAGLDVLSWMASIFKGATVK